MAAPAPTPQIRLARLSTAAPTPVLLQPDPQALQGLAAALGLLALRKVRLAGELVAEGRGDWRLEASLGATAVQPCSVTLAPVTTRIDAPVVRRYLADYTPPSETESEMPEDDTAEPLPEVLDLMAVLEEALALALPDFPRAEGAELGAATYAAPGVAPMSDAAAKPFAALAALKRDTGD